MTTIVRLDADITFATGGKQMLIDQIEDGIDVRLLESQHADALEHLDPGDLSCSQGEWLFTPGQGQAAVLIDKSLAEFREGTGLRVGIWVGRWRLVLSLSTRMEERTNRWNTTPLSAARFTADVHAPEASTGITPASPLCVVLDVESCILHAPVTP